MASLGVEQAVNLGDVFSGPIDAAGTAALLMARDFATVRGNHDRYLIEQDPSRMGPSDRVAFESLSRDHLQWIAGLPETQTIFGDVFLCHATPNSDSTYWLERVEETGAVRSASLAEITAEAEGGRGEPDPLRPYAYPALHSPAGRADHRKPRQHRLSCLR